MAASDPCSGSWLTDFFHGNTLACSSTFRGILASNEQNQIQSVADNAASAYGADSVVAQVAQQTADVQKTYAPGDVTQITNDISASDVGNPFINSSCDGFDFGSIGGGCVNKWYIYGAVALVILFVLSPYVAPFLRRK